MHGKLITAIKNKPANSQPKKTSILSKTNATKLTNLHTKIECNQLTYKWISKNWEKSFLNCSLLTGRIKSTKQQWNGYLFSIPCLLYTATPVRLDVENGILQTPINLVHRQQYIGSGRGQTKILYSYRER